MDDHDDDGSRWRSIAEEAIEEMTCPLCDGTGRDAVSPFTDSECDRCHGTGLITAPVRSQHDAQAAEVRREVAAHILLGHALFSDANDLFVRAVSNRPPSSQIPVLEMALMKNDLAQTHALLAIAELLKGA